MTIGAKATAKRALSKHSSNLSLRSPKPGSPCLALDRKRTVFLSRQSLASLAVPHSFASIPLPTADTSRAKWQRALATMDSSHTQPGAKEWRQRNDRRG
jgi:hypothetical protein